MMSKFIELHWHGEPASINVDSISIFKDMEFKDISGREYSIDESYDEVKAIIKDAGVLIHKADPRLDTTTPLTMEDLRNMEGEPVWNSNTGIWYLVHRYVNNEKTIVWAVLPDGQFKVVTADDLIKFPLYRMRQ